MTGVIISVICRIVKNPAGVNSAAHVVELNVMLGRPEGLSKPQLLPMKDHQPMPTLSSLISKEGTRLKPPGEGKTEFVLEHIED